MNFPRLALCLRRTPAVFAIAATMSGCSVTLPHTGPVTSAGPSHSAAPSRSSGSSSAPPGGQSVGAGAASTLQDSYVSVVKKVGPAVVQIETGQGLGSGIVFDNRGDIVTNAHVVGASTTFQVTFSDGKRRQGKLVGSFPAGDVAVIRVDGASVAPATFADSSKLEVGDIVMAIGNPLGLRSSVTSGIVSAVGRTVPEGNGVTLPDTIQTSAPINPGNSGGALVDLNANVVGIPTLAAADQQLGGAANGIGFAIPSNTAKDIATQLISGGVTQTHRAYLGIRGATALGGAGVVVAQVERNGPAANSGLAAGDLITAVNGQPTVSTDALNQALASLKPGAGVTLGITRADGTDAKITVTLGELPGQ